MVRNLIFTHGRMEHFLNERQAGFAEYLLE